MKARREAYSGISKWLFNEVTLILNMKHAVEEAKNGIACLRKHNRGM